MNFGMVLLIVVGLAMDAFAVSVATGIVLHKRHWQHALILGFSFGLFQMGMPLMGWLLGSRIAEIVTHIDHWLVFGILTAIGGKMIYEAFQLEAAERSPANISLWVILGLSVATSIDAFAVGLSFAFLDVSILFPVLMTGVVTCILSFAGVFIGDRFGHLFEKKIEIIAGVILILIGLKILLEHLFYF